MAEKLVMLALSPTMESGTIVRWVTSVGDTVTSGDILCEVETDKATMEYESMQEGVLRTIITPDGSRVRVGEPIAIVGTADEDISEIEAAVAKPQPAPPQHPPQTDTPPTPATEGSAAQVRAHQKPPQGGSVVAASPLARRIARERGIDLLGMHGSGPGGRVITRDLELAPAPRTATPGGRPAEGDRVIPVSEKRRVIAQRLSGSFFTAPHFFMRNPVCVDTLLGFRAQSNTGRKQKLSLNAFLIKCTAEALRRHPRVNASWSDTRIVEHASIDIALAVAQKDGLITPVVRNCASRGIEDIDTELQELVAAARDNRLAPEQYSGSTFTISNLGSSGIRDFTAIINPPEAAILAVGETFRQPVVNDSGAIVVEQTMNLTLSADHRILDGAVAAGFFSELKHIIENPARALL